MKNKVLLKDIMDIEFLQKFQDSFSKSFGVASITVDNEGIPVTNPSNFTDFCMKYTRGSKEGLTRCMKCDAVGGEESLKTGKPSVYYCHAGLMDFAAPIIVDGVQVGSIIGGQVLPKEPEEDKFKKIATEIGVNPEEYTNALNKIKIVPEDKIKSAANLLFIVANAISKLGYQQKYLLLDSDNIHNITDMMCKNINSISENMNNLYCKSSEVVTIVQDLTKNSSYTMEKVAEADDALGFIKNLAKQTKMLGLNASIESAKVGDAGKGFGVVAKEIKKCALQSDEFSKKIDFILGNIKIETEKVENKSNNLHSIVESNMEFTNCVKKMFQDMEGMIKKLEEISVHMKDMQI